AGSTTVEKIAEYAWRIRKAAPADGIAPYCERERLDFAFTPAGRRSADLKLLAMDMDSTLITIECIDELGDLAGCKSEIAAITAQAMRGELDYPQSLRKRVSLLAGLPEKALTDVYDDRLRLTPGAEELIAGCKVHGVRLLLVSGGFTFFTERLKARLGIDYTVSNILEIADGKLTGRIQENIVDATVKAEWIRRLGNELRGSDGLIVGIGDGANDLPMLANAD